MRASIVKYLFWEELYNVRQTAIIVGISEDYVRKVIKGERAKSCEPSYEEVTEGMIRRKETIDKIMGLNGAYFVDGTQKYNYISLLSYLGYTNDELKTIFPLDNSTFMSVAANRSKQAWRNFDSTLLNISPEDYNFTFIESAVDDDGDGTVDDKKGAKDQEKMEWKRNNRKEQKILSRNCKLSKNRI